MEYFDSTYDKARKPYRPIDTCSPAGTWIEEKRYNKGRPTPAESTATSRKVLCGNWQEEAALEGDLLRLEAEHEQQQQQQQQQQTLSGGASSSSAAAAQQAANSTRHGVSFGASLDVIQDRGDGRYTGGFNSSPYLTADVTDPMQRHLSTTHRQDFNQTSSDVKQLRRPELGVRSQLLLAQALVAAEEEQKRAAAERAEQQARHAEATILRSSSSSSAAVAAALANPQTVYTDSVYKTTISQARAHESTSWDKDVIDTLRQDYLSDEPITLYTGNPQNGVTMTVHGKTPVDPVSSTRFGKHTYFSERKYHL